MRPCTCDRQRQGPFTEDQCWLCWLYHNSARYRALWDSGAAQPAPTGPSGREKLTTCTHAGKRPLRDEHGKVRMSDAYY